MNKLLIIASPITIKEQLKSELSTDYALLLAKDKENALFLFRKYHPKVVLLDLGLFSNRNGHQRACNYLELFSDLCPFTKVIVMAGNNITENALTAVRTRAYYLCKKEILPVTLKSIIRKAFQEYLLEPRNCQPDGDFDKKNAFMIGMVGTCPPMLEVFSLIRKIAPSRISVLITGESGTGKELIAKAIHSLDPRKNGIFVPLNCSAIPEGLFESELFGYERGSFTGAHARSKGKIEFAHNGTLFLDEIGEFPSNLQVKLLRFLQEKSIQRIGGREDIPVDARTIAATNKHIRRSIEEGSFREDLYYRISAITINLPPLRERGNDIMLLSDFFLRKYNIEFKKMLRGFKNSSMELLKSHYWPGNIRELENRIQRAVITSESRMIEPHNLGFTEEKLVQEDIRKEFATLREARNKVEREMILSMLDRHSGNIARAARELDISRPTLYDLIKKHGICACGMSG